MPRLLARLRRNIRIAAIGPLAAAALALSSLPAAAEALLLADIATGKVLHAENATYPWYPASLSKLMTTYVTLNAVKEHRIALDTLITVSPRAAAEPPSKMGFPPGTQLTVDNALKMMLVKSANDMAVVLAEGVDGSVESFAAEMNATAQRLGMTQTHYDNPNGLPDPGQITSARDMAILARALIRDFPQDDLYWHISAIKLGKRVIRNINKLIDRYPGADGMKTGFICASGFNLVATATRNGRRLVAVVLGAPSSQARTEKAAQLLESGFDNTGALSWLTPSLGTLESLQPIDASPPDLHDEVCGRHRHRPAADDDEAGIGTSHGIALLSSLQTPEGLPLIGPLIPSMPPIVVSVVPPRKQPKTATNAPVPKPGQIAPQPLATVSPGLAGAADVQPTAFSTAALASNPPQRFAPLQPDVRVPLPRPRPHLVIRKRR